MEACDHSVTLKPAGWEVSNSPGEALALSLHVEESQGHPGRKEHARKTAILEGDVLLRHPMDALRGKMNVSMEPLSNPDPLNEKQGFYQENNRTPIHSTVTVLMNGSYQLDIA